jgi:hypothetical protein
VKSIPYDRIPLLAGYHFHPAAYLTIGHNFMFFVSKHSIYFTLYNFFGLALSWFLALQSQNQIRSTVKSTVELQNCSNHVLKTGIDKAEDARSSSALSIPRKLGKTVEIEINETVR